MGHPEAEVFGRPDCWRFRPDRKFGSGTGLFEQRSGNAAMRYPGAGTPRKHKHIP